MGNTELEALLVDTKGVIGGVINEVISKEADKRLREALEHALRPVSERERPFLFRLIIEEEGVSFGDTSYVAAAVEFFHFSSLVLDDVIDHSKLRRDSSTLWHSKGVEYAVIVGSYLRSLAALMLAEESLALGLDSRTVSRLTESGMQAVYVGQLLEYDRVREGHYHSRQEAAWNCKLITGSLYEVTAGMAALCAGVSSRRTKAWQRFGCAYGVAMQVVDDIHDAQHAESENEMLAARLRLQAGMPDSASSNETQVEQYKNIGRASLMSATTVLKELNIGPGALRQWTVSAGHLLS